MVAISICWLDNAAPFIILVHLEAVANDLIDDSLTQPLAANCMPSLVLLAKLCVGPLVLGEAASPMCTGHVDLFLFFLAEAFRLTHEEVKEDNRYACDASKDEECALG